MNKPGDSNPCKTHQCSIFGMPTSETSEIRALNTCPLLTGDPPRRVYYFQPLTLSFMSSVAPYASTTNLPIPMDIDAGRTYRINANRLEPRCSHRRARRDGGNVYCRSMFIGSYW